MKLVITKSLRLTCLLFLIVAFAFITASAQDVRLQLDNLNKLEPKASESVEVTLDGQLLRLAISFLDRKDPKQAEIRDAVSGLKGIYVKSFNFDKEGMYATADVDSLRAQLRSPAWTRMVGVKSNKEGKNLEFYMMMSGNLVNGIAVIATDPKELTVVNIVGSIDLEKLVKLSGKLGIPDLDIDLGKEKKK
ncbi:MAG TPA: DUF4252 domain-containing protein [Pyrinomonadaceae bacterium]|nr:DUF4252 domain-containing protein [Pyrinomonadaceae bacterium]